MYESLVVMNDSVLIKRLSELNFVNGNINLGKEILFVKLISFELIRFFLLLLSGFKLNSTPASKELVIFMPSLFRFRFRKEILPDKPSRLPALAAVTLLVLLDAE